MSYTAKTEEYAKLIYFKLIFQLIFQTPANPEYEKNWFTRIPVMMG